MQQTLDRTTIIATAPRSPDCPVTPATPAMPRTQRFVLPNRRGSVLKGCLIAVAVILVLVIGLGIFVAMTWRGFVAGTIKTASVQAISESSLPQDQKDRLTTRMTGLADDFKNGTLTFPQIVQIMQSIEQSPLIPLATVYAASSKLVEPSDLTTEEKAAAQRSIGRFARGVVEEKISSTAMDDVLASVATRGQNGQFELKQSATIEEVRTFIAAAKAKADDASIPDEDFQFDVATEVDKVIDRGLQK